MKDRFFIPVLMALIIAALASYAAFFIIIAYGAFGGDANKDSYPRIVQSPAKPETPKRARRDKDLDPIYQRQLSKFIDSNRDGKISLKEFKKIDSLFIKFDIDQNRELDQEEFERLFRTMNEEHGEGIEDSD